MIEPQREGRAAAPSRRRASVAPVLTLLAAVSSATPAAGAGPVLYVSHQAEDFVLALDPQTLEVVAQIPHTPVLAVLPDGRHVYVPAESGLAEIDTTSNQIVGTVDLGAATTPARSTALTAAVGPHTSAVGVSPDGDFLYVPYLASRNPDVSRIAVVATASNSVAHRIDVPNYPASTSVTLDDAQVLVPFLMSQTVARIATASNEVVGEADFGSAVDSSVAFSPDGSKAYLCTQDGLVVADAATLATLSQLPIELGCFAPVARQDGQRVYVSLGTNDAVAVIDVAENEIVDTILVARHPRGLALSTDGSRLYVSSTESDTLSVIDTATNEVVKTTQVGSEPTYLAYVVVPPLVTPTATPSPTPTAARASSGGGCDAGSTSSPAGLAAALAYFKRRRKAR